MGERRLRLGRVKTTTKTGHLVVEIEDKNLRLRLQWPVHTKDGRKVGVISDIIGNIDRPYAVVKLFEKGEGVREGDTLFTVIPERKRRGAKRHGRRRGGKGQKRSRSQSKRSNRYSGTSPNLRRQREKRGARQRR
ncbi:MAG: hypothetical protein GSR72_01215 [Desulfurococcales archaeon]|nr:hypothetical protein [Desulfurococcales archaeon]